MSVCVQKYQNSKALRDSCCAFPLTKSRFASLKCTCISDETKEMQTLKKILSATLRSTDIFDPCVPSHFFTDFF